MEQHLADPSSTPRGGRGPGAAARGDSLRRAAGAAGVAAAGQPVHGRRHRVRRGDPLRTAGARGGRAGLAPEGALRPGDRIGSALDVFPARASRVSDGGQAQRHDRERCHLAHRRSRALPGDAGEPCRCRRATGRRDAGGDRRSRRHAAGFRAHRARRQSGAIRGDRRADSRAGGELCPLCARHRGRRGAAPALDAAGAEPHAGLRAHEGGARQDRQGVPHRRRAAVAQDHRRGRSREDADRSGGLREGAAPQGRGRRRSRPHLCGGLQPRRRLLQVPAQPEGLREVPRRADHAVPAGRCGGAARAPDPAWSGNRSRFGPHIGHGDFEAAASRARSCRSSRTRPDARSALPADLSPRAESHAQ